MSNTTTRVYRGWEIYPDSNGYGYHGTGPDFDGEEDPRHVHGWTVQQVVDGIDDYLEDNPEDEGMGIPI